MTRLDRVSVCRRGSGPIAAIRWDMVVAVLSFVVLTGLWACLWVH